MLQVRHAELLTVVGAALHAVSAAPGEVFDVEADHCLMEDFTLDGAQLLRLAELLEEELQLTLTPAFLIDLVREGPTVGRLTRRLAHMQEDKRHAR